MNDIHTYTYIHTYIHTYMYCKLTAPLLKNIWKKEDNVMASSSTVKRRLTDARLNVKYQWGKHCYCQDTNNVSNRQRITGNGQKICGRKFYVLTSPSLIFSIVMVECTYNIDHQNNLMMTVTGHSKEWLVAAVWWCGDVSVGMKRVC